MSSNNMTSNLFYKLFMPAADLPMEWHTYDKHPGCEMAIDNQKNCCMCWAIAACDCVSMGIKIVGKHPNVVKLYSKHLLDCANSLELDSLVCYKLKKAFRYMAESGVMRQPAHSPFLPEKGPCSHHVTVEEELVKIAGYENIDCNDEKALMYAVTRYPICGVVIVTGEFCRIKGASFGFSLMETKNSGNSFEKDEDDLSMTDEEEALYKKSLEESEGFDVVYFPSGVNDLGIILPINIEHRGVLFYANMAIEVFNKSIHKVAEENLILEKLWRRSSCRWSSVL